MKKIKLFLSIFFIAIILSGVLVIVLSTNSVNEYEKFIKTAEYTEGEISDIVTKKIGGDVIQRAYVKYVVGETEYEVECRYYLSTMYKGQKIGVYHDKNNPEKYMIEETVTSNYVPVIIGTVFILSGALPLLITVICSAVKSLKYKKITRKGIRVDANVISIDLNTDYSYSGKHPYKVTVQCINPLIGASDVYVSNNLWDDPNGYLQLGDIVPIYFNNKDSKKYYIDIESVKKNAGLIVYDSSINNT